MKIAEVSSGNIRINDIKKLSLDNKQGAIVRVLGCGLCGSDIVKLKHGLASDGTVLGHEIVAIIEEINSDTDFQVGDKIVSSHHIPCFECTYCKHGNFSMCEHFKKTNLHPGGFSEYVYLTEKHLKNVAYKVPNNISDEEISFYEPLACCVRAIRRANLQKNDTVLVIGLGSIGLIMAQALKTFGYNVIACDLINERIDFAKSKNINAYNSQNLEEFNLTIQNLTNKFGVDAVFMTSGADKAIDVATKVIKSGGKIIVFSSTPLNHGYTNNDIYYKELSIMGSYSPSPEDLKISFDLLVNKNVNVKNCTQIYNFKDIQNAFDDTISNKTFKAYIKIS